MAFQEYTLSERISKLGYMLRDTKFRISLDHPREITCARKTLSPDLKQAKDLNPLAKVTILYPAKLVLKGRVVKDLFPEWDSIMRGNRLNTMHQSQECEKQYSMPTHAKQSTPIVKAPSTNEINSTSLVDMDVIIQDDCADKNNESMSLLNPSRATGTNTDTNKCGSTERTNDESTFQSQQTSVRGSQRESRRAAA